MERILLVATMVLVAVPASADVGQRPAGGCGGCSPARAGPAVTGGTLTRGQFLTIGSIVVGAFGAADVVETVRTGKPNFNVVGVQLVASIPIVLFGVDFVRADSSDCRQLHCPPADGLLRPDLSAGSHRAGLHSAYSATVDLPDARARVMIESTPREGPHTSISQIPALSIVPCRNDTKRGRMRSRFRRR